MDKQNAYNLVALRRAASTLSADAREVANALAEVSSRLTSGQAALEASGSLRAGHTLPGAYWSLVHVAQALPWLLAEVQLLAAALPNVISGQAASLPADHPWRQMERPSPLRLDEDLFDAQFS
jgi:hypothetical protein